MKAFIKTKYVVVLLLLSFEHTVLGINNMAISYILNGGRLGDNLVNFCHAKYHAMMNEADFLYVPFAYSDQLMIHELEPLSYEKEKHKYEHVVNIVPGQQPVYQDNSLYMFPYCTEAPIELKDPREAALYEICKVDWKNKKHIDEIRSLIKPRFEIIRPRLPKDKITVAVHIRLGGAYEADRYLDRTAPTVICKMPPLSFFIEQLRWLSDFFKDQPLYVYVFTDDSNPVSIMNAIAQGVNRGNIEYDCRKHKNHWAHNVLDDLFAMTYFDCLIRSTSNFTFIASKLKDYKVLISALDAQFLYGEPVVTQVSIAGTMVGEPV